MSVLAQVFAVSTQKSTLSFLEANKVLPNFMLVALTFEYVYTSFSTDRNPQGLKPASGLCITLSGGRFPNPITGRSALSTWPLLARDLRYLEFLHTLWVSGIPYPSRLLGRMPTTPPSHPQPRFLPLHSWTHLENRGYTPLPCSECSLLPDAILKPCLLLCSFRFGTLLANLVSKIHCITNGAIFQLLS